MNPLLQRQLLNRLHSSALVTTSPTLSIPTTLLYRTSLRHTTNKNIHTISLSASASASSTQSHEAHRHLTNPRTLHYNPLNAFSHRLMSTAASSSHSDSPVHSTHHPDEEEEVYTQDGWLFNQDPNRPCNDPVDRQLAILWTVTSILFIGYMAFMMHFKPETSIRRWAREEALERGVFVPPLRPDLTDDDEL